MPTRLDEVYDAWRSTDSALEGNAVEGADQYRPVNSAAYFLLLFAQLEQSLDALYRGVIGSPDERPFLSRLDLLSGYLPDHAGLFPCLSITIPSSHFTTSQNRGGPNPGRRRYEI
jgi:hypothetical protein